MSTLKLAFPRRQRASTYTQTHKRTGMFYANAKCIVTEWSERCTRRSVRAKRTLCVLHFASVKKSCTDISVCVQPFQVNFATMMRNAYIAAVFVSDAIAHTLCWLFVCR